MHKNNFDAFSCTQLNFKNSAVLQSAPEHAIFIQKLEKIGGGVRERTAPSAPTPQRLRRLDPPAFGARHLPPLQNPRYATAQNVQQLLHCTTGSR